MAPDATHDDDLEVLRRNRDALARSLVDLIERQAEQSAHLAQLMIRVDRIETELQIDEPDVRL